MTESIENWWLRRRRSKQADVPYPIGTFRADWARFPMLIRQFHPELNGLVTLTQIPPAADVYLLWVCDSGHRFVATPTEQRERPGRSRRRSTWCPECTAVAVDWPTRVRNPAPRQPVPARSDRARASSRAHRGGTSRAQATDEWMSPGMAFFSERAPRPSSAAEADLRARIAGRLDVDLASNAIRIRSAFHGRHEVWPDIVIPELMVAVEYDTTGSSSTEHVGSRESSDRRKDQLLRQVGWEVIRIRTSKLEPLGPFDVTASGVSNAVVDHVVDRLAEIRGDLIVAAYLTPATAT